MKTILSMLIFAALFAAIVGSRWNLGYGIPHKQVKLPNGQLCKEPGDSCSKRDECCKADDQKTYSSGCAQTWSAMAGGFCLGNATYAPWNHPCAKFSCNKPDK
uniref:U13-Hexatoxin-Hf1l_1 n=1 Tax=Hadronyche formidabilis TaxID=426499 RepID=A0A4Q8K4P6_HADFO